MTKQPARNPAARLRPFRSGLCLFGVFIVAVAVLAFTAAWTAAPMNYPEKTPAGGSLEAKYLARGKHRVEAFRTGAAAPMEHITVFFPEEMRTGAGRWPVVVMVNGTGIMPNGYQAVFRHLASWGFIVIGNDDPSTWSGESADRTLEWLLEENENPESIFFNRVDIGNIGISGHSQGGIGVLNAVTIQPHANLYRTAVTLSPTNDESAERLHWSCNLEAVGIPTMMIAGTDGDFETRMVIPLERMREMYRKLPSSKLMVRRKGCGHGETLYAADGYVTAWFMWLLRSDGEAAKAFTGPVPEIKVNSLYRNLHIDIPADFAPIKP